MGRLPEHVDDEDDEGVQVEEAHDVGDGQTETQDVADEESLDQVAQVDHHFFEQRDVGGLHLVRRGDAPDEREHREDDLESAEDEQHLLLFFHVVDLSVDEDGFPVFGELDVVAVSG